jgi:hypothetical protein
MLVSNQRPLPCECEVAMLWRFVGVRETAEIAALLLGDGRARSPLCVRGGVLLV